MQINDLESLAKKYRREIFEKFLKRNKVIQVQFFHDGNCCKLILWRFLEI